MRSWPRGAGAVPALVVGLLLFGACGPSRSAASAISAGASASLTQQVSAVRAAAARGDRPGARSDLDRLRAAVATFEQQGQVSAARAATILSAAAEVEAQLATPSTTTTTSASTSGTATSTVPAPSGPATGGSSRTTTREPAGGGGGDKGRGKDRGK